MTNFEFICFVLGAASPALVAIGLGVYYTIKDLMSRKEKSDAE